MDFTFYGDNKGGVLKLDPRTKFLIFLTSGIMTLSNYSDIGAAIYCIVLLGIYALCGKPLSALKGGLVLGAVIFLRSVLQNSQGAPSVIVLLVSVLTTVFMFAFPSVLSILLLVKTTRISQFLSAFQAMHLPVAVIVPVAVFFRFLPTVADEWNGIRKAMAFRGISTDPVEVICHPWRTIEYMLIPMLFSSVTVMEELAAASVSRGLEIDVKRTSYEEVKLKAVDYAVIILFAGMLVLQLLQEVKSEEV